MSAEKVPRAADHNCPDQAPPGVEADLRNLWLLAVAFYELSGPGARGVPWYSCTLRSVRYTKYASSYGTPHQVRFVALS
eukprot:6417484-Prymnesium_polylepis.1